MGAAGCHLDAVTWAVAAGTAIEPVNLGAGCVLRQLRQLRAMGRPAFFPQRVAPAAAAGWRRFGGALSGPASRRAGPSTAGSLAQQPALQAACAARSTAAANLAPRGALRIPAQPPRVALCRCPTAATSCKIKSFPFLNEFPGTHLLQGDYHRYLAEFKTGAERKEAAEHTLLAYKAAQVGATAGGGQGAGAAACVLCPRALPVDLGAAARSG